MPAAHRDLTLWVNGVATIGGCLAAALAPEWAEPYAAAVIGLAALNVILRLVERARVHRDERRLIRFDPGRPRTPRS